MTHTRVVRKRLRLGGLRIESMDCGRECLLNSFCERGEPLHRGAGWKRGNNSSVADFYAQSLKGHYFKLCGALINTLLLNINI